jgi:hypothetical protein
MVNLNKMDTTGLKTSGTPMFTHIGLLKYGKEKPLSAQVNLNKYFKIKESEEYTDTEILVYNSMLNAAGIIAKNS